MWENVNGSDEYWMTLALEEAKAAFEIGEVPIGAVIIKDDELLSKAHNFRETWKDATAHAELIAIRRACEKLGGWRLQGCTMYVTVEPCPMCAGAMVQARVDRLVFGASDPKAWGRLTIEQLLENPNLNHQISITKSCLESDSAQLMKQFFRDLRDNK